MSLALPSNGKLITLDKNSVTNKVAYDFFKKAKQDNKISSITGNALKSLASLKKDGNKFNLVFIDADKENYKNYYDQSLELIETNDLIIIDNVLWHGEVFKKRNRNEISLPCRWRCAELCSQWETIAI